MGQRVWALDSKTGKRLWAQQLSDEGSTANVTWNYGAAKEGDYILMYGSGTSVYEKNPFDEAPKPINPRSKPVGGGR